MIQQIENGDGLVKVVASWNEVETQSLLGFRLIGMYQEGDYTSLQEQVPDPTAGYSGATTYVTRYIPTSQTFFIMRKDEASALESMQLTLDNTRKELDESKNAFNEKEKEAQHYQESWEGQKRTIERMGGDLTACEEGQRALRSSNNKLEADLGKLREAIGTKQFNDILGVEK